MTATTRRFLLPLLALGLCLPLASRADTAKSTGTITGKVMTADGKAAASVKVSVYAATMKAKKPAADAKPAPTAKLAAGDAPATKPVRAAALFTATTDENGAYSIADVPAGDYTVSVNAKGLGRGTTKVKVEAGQSATADITLKDSPKKPK